MFETSKLPTEQRTVTGNSVSFNTHYALPLDACKVTFSATESGTGEKSPSNPYTISGVSGLNLSANSVPVSVNFGDTYYGGELDVLTGDLTITYKRIVLNGTENYTNNALRKGFWYYDSQMFGAFYNDGICDKFNTLYTDNRGEVMGAIFGLGNNYIFFTGVVGTLIEEQDVDAWKTWVTDNPLELIYPLGNRWKTHVQLTPQELQTILGTNTFSTDTGSLEISFQDLQEKSASGAIATFNTALAMPLVNGEFSIEAYQEGTGDPSPVNVRNIVGYDKMHINVVNFNQITENGNFATGDIWSPFPDYGDYSYANNEGIYTLISVENDRYKNTFRYGFYMTVGHKYFFTADYYVSKESRALIYNIGNAFIKDQIIPSGWSRIQSIMNATFQTSGRKSCYIGLEFCEDYNYQVDDTYKMKNVMCFDLTQLFGSRIADYLYNLESNQEGAGVAIFRQLFYKDYYDYNVGGHWVSVASVNGDDYPDYLTTYFGDTYYDGYYNPVSGKLLATSVKQIYNGTHLIKLVNWRPTSTSVGFAFDPSTYIGIRPSSATALSNIRCNKLKTVTYNQIYNGAIDSEISISTDLNYGLFMRLPDLSLTTSEAINQYLSENPIEVVYDLAEPIKIDIGPTELRTFIGNNTFFCDTGDTSLTYKDCDLAKRGDFRQVFKIPD